MINIDLDTPSDNCSFRCFRAVKLYKLVCWSDCVIFGFDQDGEYLLKFTKLSTAQDEECPKVLFYI